MTRVLGRYYKYYKKIDSTQLEILREIENKSIKNGELVIAEIQENGIRNTWKTVVYR